MQSGNNQFLNPWFSMWTKPRATIQQIVETNPERLVLIIAAASGFSQVLGRLGSKGAGDSHGLYGVLLIAGISGPISGILLLYIGAALLRWTGGLLAGKASSMNLRAALAWSNVPAMWALILLLPAELAIFGEEIFTTHTPMVDASPNLGVVLFGFGLVELTVVVWTLVISLKCIGQVQGFSAWKALGNVLLAGLVVIVPTAVIVGLA